MAFASRWQVVIGRQLDSRAKFPICGFSRLNIRLDRRAARAPLQKVPEFLCPAEDKARRKSFPPPGIMIDPSMSVAIP
jgi:hypothetical protein